VQVSGAEPRQQTSEGDFKLGEPKVNTIVADSSEQNAQVADRKAAWRRRRGMDLMNARISRKNRQQELHFVAFRVIPVTQRLMA
jgi:hypothetical protein